MAKKKHAKDKKDRVFFGMIEFAETTKQKKIVPVDNKIFTPKKKQMN